MKRFQAVLSLFLSAAALCGLGWTAGSVPAFAETPSDPDYTEIRAGDIYPEDIGSPAVLKPDGSLTGIADGIDAAYARRFDLARGVNILELYVENHTDFTLTIYAPRMRADGLEMDHRLYDRLQPGHRTFIQLETRSALLKAAGIGEIREQEFQLLILKDNDPVPIYNNTVVCRSDQTPDSPAREEPETSPVRLECAYVTVLGYQRIGTGAETRIEFYVQIRNNADRTLSFLLRDAAVDGCPGLTTRGVWCDPGKDAILTAEVSEEDFLAMAESADDVELSFRLEASEMDRLGAYNLFSGCEGTDSVEVQTGWLETA